MNSTIDNRLREQQWKNGYEDYEMLGDCYSGVNCNQAYLCYENAAYLCKDTAEQQRILEKKNRMSRSEGFSVHKASIVIVSYNSMYLMQKCLESIRQTCSPDMYETIVVENASTDGVREWLVQQEDEKIILLDQNVGFTIGCNIGVEYTEPNNDIFLLNNDTRLTPNALFWLRMGLYESENIGACGCIANYCGNAQNVDIQFTLPAEYMEYGARNNVYMANPYEERNRLSGFAMLIKRCAWNATEGMDEAYSPGYMEDDDLSMQLRKAGYRIFICHNSYIYHAGSQSFSKQNNLEEIFTKNYYYLLNKWNFNVLNKSEVNQKAIDEIKRQPDEKFSVLQIGAGCGTTLARIKYLYPNAEVYGIEDSREAVEVAPEQSNVVWCNLYSDSFPFERIEYDYVFFSEDAEKEVFYRKISKKSITRANRLIGEGRLVQALRILEPLQDIVDDVKQIIPEIKKCIEQEQNDYRKKLYVDVMGKEYEEKVLIVYVASAFEGLCFHTNAKEIYAMAEVFSEKGFRVDVVDYQYYGDLNDVSDYKIMIGQGDYFEKMCKDSSSTHTKKIAYLTTMPPHFNNLSELSRLRYFEERNGVKPKTERMTNFFSDMEAVLNIDCAIGIGTGEKVYDGWKEYFSKLYIINATGFNDIKLPEIDKRSDRVKNFLWFGSTGGIHKGLDLLIEAFRDIQDCNLHIVGAGFDTDLLEFYRCDIEQCDNICYYSWLDHASTELREVFEKCGFIVCPSCSERQCTSVLTSMYAGLVPICTLETGIDMEKTGGITIQSIVPSDLAMLIKKVSEMTMDEYRRREQCSYDYVIKNHSIDKYKEMFTEAVNKILSD